MLDMFTDRDLAFMALDNHHHDYDAQLRAIHDMLSVHRRDTEKFAERIRELEIYTAKETGAVAERGVDETIDHYHHSVYRDAAHSMAAVGMLAPFVESLHFHLFEGIGHLLISRGLPLSPHPRWSLKPNQLWDCHFDQTGGKNIVKGIPDLAEAIGLLPDLPTDFQPTLAALFRYRNSMFHQGFEWPSEERIAFTKAKAAWPTEWFSKATTGGEPWIYYFSDAFVDHVLSTVERTLEVVGRYLRPLL